MHLYWVLGLIVLMLDSQSDWDAWHCQFSNQIRRSFLQTRLRPDSVLQNEFISLWILYKSCSPIRLDEFGFLNRLILISEAQDISFWRFNMKAKNHVARRVLAWVCRSDSRDYGPAWRIFFGPRTELKSAKMRDLIEDEIRRKWVGF
jgi:hypothetical protein